MIKIDKHIEIVSSSETVLSSMSQESRDAVLAVLGQHYTNVRITIVNDLADLEALVARKPDLVFLGMKFIPLNPDFDLRGPDRIWVCDYLDEWGIAYTGSDGAAHILELNKHLSKQRVLDFGLKTAPFYVVAQNQPSLKLRSLPFPLFIKPTDRGGGLGINSDSVVRDSVALRLKVQALACDLQSDSLVEQYLNGREFSVAILKDTFLNEFSVMPIELVAQPDGRGSRLLSGEVKSSNAETVLEVKDEALYAKIRKFALEVFHALGARDYGRIDIRLDEFGVPHFLEANLLPSLISGYGSFPKACLLNIGLGYEQMILRIAELGLARSENELERIPEPVMITGSVPGIVAAEPA